MLTRSFLMCLALGAGPVFGDISLDMPVDCELGKTCFIQQYVDRDEGPGARDYQGRALSYDGHKGTDFRVISDRDMAAGVDVLAAAPGVVRAVRDGMADVRVTDETRGDIAGRECGNGVVIQHAEGWETQYCHLLRGSIAVERGQSVAAGERVGQIGLSGLTEFPHVHFAVRHNEAVVDPFLPGPVPGCERCTTGNLWNETPAYTDAVLMTVGFSDSIPSFASIKRGEARLAELAEASPALVMWVHALGKVPGDVLELALLAPDGSELATNSKRFERHQATYFEAVGVRKRGPWSSGQYTARAGLLRNGKVISQQTATLSFAVD